MRKAETIFLEANRWALIGILSAMAILVFTNVTLRYVTNHSITWSDEVARHMMIWLTFIGAGLTLRHGGLVAIDNLQLALSERKAFLVRILVAIIMLAFFVTMIWAGKSYVERTMFQTTPSTRIPFGYIYLAMPIGFGLLIVHVLLVLKTYLKGGMSALQGEDDAPPVAA
ncbi:TRAP transporter small permease [Neorhizobium sp. T786]|uniref:TRAP transporter small permease n=1 Tax=Pseudorhizobium xiangyangii TaxID=2883104 RepID=UPI001CFF7599|nr:TRAP transporter small permease [Neorhizobium xiangyangii]MCB5204884.1 TRAP transporter small permease [Neorhizobium xiangyangii]